MLVTHERPDIFNPWETISLNQIYQLSFDGLFRGTKGTNLAGFMCFGWLIQFDDELIAKGYGIGARGVDATSNIAEYLALIDGLQTMVDMGIKETPIVVSGDAKVVINQMRGDAKIGTDRVIPMYRHAHRLAQMLRVIDWRWVPRRQYKATDMLTRSARREFRQDYNEFQQAHAKILRENAAQSDQLHIFGGMLIFQGDEYG